jgi:hypothetical protein
LASSTIKAGRPAPDSSCLWVTVEPVDAEASTIATPSPEQAPGDEDEKQKGATT